MRLAVSLLCATLALTACAPRSPEQIERICADRARDAAAPRGSVGVGVGSGGVSTSASVRVTGDFLRGRDPDAVYADCVARGGGGNTFGIGVSS